MILEIRSGFQSGADIAGIKAARAVQFPTTGWMPKGWLTEDGPRPEYGPTYGAKEHSSEKYPPRTFLNVKDADATILFVSAKAKTERGCDLTREACSKGKLNKPLLEIPVWSTPDRVPPVAWVAGLIRSKGFKSLNIAGTRGSADPPIAGVAGSGIEAFTFCWCLTLFEILKESP